MLYPAPMSDIAERLDSFPAKTALERIKLAAQAFGKHLVATTSGGETSAVLLHLLKQAKVDTPTIFVDTGHYPASTYKQIDTLKQLGYDIRTYRAETSKHIQPLQKRDPVAFRHHIKHEPLNRAFRELNANAWLRGIMRWQTEERTTYPFVRKRKGLWQLHPLLDWTREEAISYCKKHHLPINTAHHDITKEAATNECRIGDYCGIN